MKLSLPLDRPTPNPVLRHDLTNISPLSFLPFHNLHSVSFSLSFPFPQPVALRHSIPRTPSLLNRNGEERRTDNFLPVFVFSTCSILLHLGIYYIRNSLSTTVLCRDESGLGITDFRRDRGRHRCFYRRRYQAMWTEVHQRSR